MGERPQVVIVGGGFAGLAAARALAGAPVDVTLLDRKNHHLFQPLLYQVAMAGLAAPDIAAPIRKILRRQRNVTVLLAEVRSVDPAARRIEHEFGALTYDYLVVAAGATHTYFGHDDWARHAPGLKTLEDAFHIRRRVLLAFEAAEREGDPERRRPWLTFAVVGGGPTGVELAGALAEIASHTLARDFRRFDPKEARVVLVEGGPRILGAFSEAQSASAKAQLEDLGVEVVVGQGVTRIDADGLTLGERRIECRTVLWAAGVRGAPLAETLGAPLDRAGKVLVEPDLSVPGHPEVFVAGDLAASTLPDGRPVPALAPAAVQAGRHVGLAILGRLAGRAPPPFRYVDKGIMATIGRRRAVAKIGALELGGLLAWMAWLFVHVLFLIGFRNRLVVMFEWAWAYFTYQRSARLILDAGREVSGGPAGSALVDAPEAREPAARS